MWLIKPTLMAWFGLELALKQTSQRQNSKPKGILTLKQCQVEANKFEYFKTNSGQFDAALGHLVKHDKDRVLPSESFFTLLSNLIIISAVTTSDVYLMPALLSNVYNSAAKVEEIHGRSIGLHCASILVEAVHLVVCSVHLWPLYFSQRIGSYPRMKKVLNAVFKIVSLLRTRRLL